MKRRNRPVWLKNVYQNLRQIKYNRKLQYVTVLLTIILSSLFSVAAMSLQNQQNQRTPVDDLNNFTPVGYQMNGRDRNKNDVPVDQEKTANNNKTILAVEGKKDNKLPKTSPEACSNNNSKFLPRDMWIWQSSVASDANQRSTMLEFAKSRNVRTIYMESEKLINSDQRSLSTLLVEAKNNCINVELLFGAADWSFNRNHSYVESLVQKSVDFAKSTSVPPVGVHFDVEPYNLDEYKADINSGANQYLDMLEKIRAITKKSSLYFSKSMPLGFEFQTITRAGVQTKMSHATIERVDRIALMDYRDTADRIIADAADEFQHAAKVGTKMVIGVETDCNTGEVQTITFCEEGNAYMESQLTQVHKAYKNNSAYTGLAIHDYAAYKTLRQ